jgi:hypothetical protein
MTNAKTRPIVVVKPLTRGASRATPASGSPQSGVPIRDRVRRAENRSDAASAEYEVGYRRPPRHTRFRKGTSGNPKGRPKGAKNFLTVLKKELLGTIRITEGGRAYVVTKLEALIKTRINRSLQGDKRDLDRIFPLMERYFSADDAAPVSVDVGEQDRRILDRYAERLMAMATSNRKKEGGK